MTAVLARELQASYAFVERNFNLSKRYWGWEMAFMVYSVAGALSVTLIGRDQNSDRLILSLMIGATFWNYLSVVFSIIAEQISWEQRHWQSPPRQRSLPRKCRRAPHAPWPLLRQRASAPGPGLARALSTWW
jgi:hypothetical protein